MCKKSRKNYFMMMGLITLIIACAMIIGLIVKVVNQFQANATFWPICATFLNMLAVMVMGTGIANLFYSQAFMGCNCDKE